MTNEFHFFADLNAEASIPENGILSRTLYQDDHVKELSAYTPPMPALTLGSETRQATLRCSLNVQAE